MNVYFLFYLSVIEAKHVIFLLKSCHDMKFIECLVCDIC